ncbi:MAG: ADP-ribosylation factor-like protein [Candidatus Heimdallarchaeota archaeon]
MEGEGEVFAYKPEQPEELFGTPQLISAFMEAMRAFSKPLDPIQQIQFSNLMLYTKTYENFTLQLLFDEKIHMEEIQGLFEQLSKEIMQILTENQKIGFPSKEVFQKKLEPILTPLVHDPLVGSIQEFGKQKVIPKIGLVGLENAGKTSIKNVFFENWSKDRVMKIKPTIDVEITQKFQEFIDQSLLIMDFGGQVAYRKQYLTLDKYYLMWKEMSALIFVVDLQDPETFETAKDYLSEVWNIVSKINESPPRLAIFFHKYDPPKREELHSNIQQCLIIFREFIDFATFYLTTIEDSSSNLALIKTFYFSLPDIMLRRILEEEFLEHFEKVILPAFYQVTQEFRDGVESFTNGLKSKLHKSAVTIGTAYGPSLQRTWMQYLMGEWNPRPHPKLSSRILVVQRGQSLFITIDYQIIQGFPKELITTLFDGVLEGVLKTFHLDAPRIVEDKGVFTTWKIDL